jgi:hypothetical protein
VELIGTFRRQPSDCQPMKIDIDLLFFIVSELPCAWFFAWFSNSVKEKNEFHQSNPLRGRNAGNPTVTFSL